MGSRVEGKGSGLRVEGSEFLVLGFSGFGFRVLCLGFWVEDLRFRVEG